MIKVQSSLELIKTSGLVSNGMHQNLLCLFTGTPKDVCTLTIYTQRYKLRTSQTTQWTAAGFHGAQAPSESVDGSRLHTSKPACVSLSPGRKKNLPGRTRKVSQENED